MPGSTLGGSLHIGVGVLLSHEVRVQVLMELRLIVGWAKYMEWMYPVEVAITNKTAFKATGAVSAAATL